jgi:hypothetical protein
MHDWPLHILNAQYGDVGYLDEILAVYRIHNQGSWSSQSKISTLQGSIQAASLLLPLLDPPYQSILSESIAHWQLRVVKLLLSERNTTATMAFLRHEWDAMRLSPRALIRVLSGRRSYRRRE